ncbi:MAG: hypothetical protein ACE5HQ_10855 [Gemmatimonadota bacterium]
MATRYAYRSVHLEKSEVEVENVLVAVCEACGEMVSIPAQSTPRLKAAREEKTVVLNARMPPHLDDVLRLLADHFDAPSWSFCPGFVRFYLHELAENEGFARRVRRLAESGLAGGSATSKLSVRTSRKLASSAWKRAREQGVRTRTDMLKGVILAGYQDVLEGRAPRRARALEGIAAAA